MTISKRVRFEVLRRDNFNCMYCGRIAPDVVLHVDHVVPTALGGSDDPSNLVAACADCNSGKASIQPDSPLVERVSDHAAAYALGMLDKLTHLRADLEREKVWEAEFLAKWNEWTYTDRRQVAVSRRDAAAAWLHAVGTEAAQHSEVQEMSNDRLFINVESAAWRSQLELQRTALTARWNEFVPGLKVASVIVQSSRASFPRYADSAAGFVTVEERKNIALPSSWRTSVVRWKSMGIPDLLFDKAIRIAMEKRDIKGQDGEFAYMAGVIWRTVDALEVDYDLTPEHAATYTEGDLTKRIAAAREDGWSEGWDDGTANHALLDSARDAVRHHIDSGPDHWALQRMRTTHRGT